MKRYEGKQNVVCFRESKGKIICYVESGGMYDVSQKHKESDALVSLSPSLPFSICLVLVICQEQMCSL